MRLSIRSCFRLPRHPSCLFLHCHSFFSFSGSIIPGLFHPCIILLLLSDLIGIDTSTVLPTMHTLLFVSNLLIPLPFLLLLLLLLLLPFPSILLPNSLSFHPLLLFFLLHFRFLTFLLHPSIPFDIRTFLLLPSYPSLILHHRVSFGLPNFFDNTLLSYFLRAYSCHGEVIVGVVVVWVCSSVYLLLRSFSSCMLSLSLLLF
mmetsp:Transcript_18167/g.26639  ORF Transcript_18167/g.26639 Transcript_18167/m.26639 type:complete len:202 (+) Transcript_18167:745-1350(+)